MKRNTWKKGFVLIVIAIFVATMNIPSICANFIDSMNINTSPGIPEIWGQIQVEINKVAHYFAKTNYSGDNPISLK